VPIIARRIGEGFEFMGWILAEKWFLDKAAFEVSTAYFANHEENVLAKNARSDSVAALPLIPKTWPPKPKK
jgi:hypothetical protein